MSYNLLLQNITNRLSESEKNFLFECIKEEVKYLRTNDILLAGQEKPRPVFWLNRDIYKMRTENLQALEIIDDKIALESPLQALNWLINNIEPLTAQKKTAIIFLLKSFNSRNGEADAISEKIEAIIKNSHTPFNIISSDIIAFLIEVNYGSGMRTGLKHRDSNYQERIIHIIRSIFRKFNNNPIDPNTILISRALILVLNHEIFIIDNEIRKCVRNNRNAATQELFKTQLMELKEQIKEWIL
jgi:hypothetical protein